MGVTDLIFKLNNFKPKISVISQTQNIDHGVKSERMEMIGGVPQCSKLGPIAFIIKINQLPSVTNWESAETTNQNYTDEGEITMFMDDTTLSEVIEVSDHTSGTSIGKTQENVNNVLLFAKHEKIELNVKNRFQEE
jgi:hypothetical protein